MMTIKRIGDSEGDLLNIIQDICPLEWRKYRKRCPEVWVVDHFEKVDRSEIPPYVAFRFEKESEEVVHKLKMAITSYRGEVEWMLREHKRQSLPGTNWVISPVRLKTIEETAHSLNISPEKYMAQYEPEFGAIAYDDITQLARHVQMYFSSGVSSVSL